MSTKASNNGLHTEYYESGQKELEGNYKDGEKEGKWTRFYENGQILYEFNYKEGKKNGKWTEWHKNGQKKSQRNYIDRKLHGKWTRWYENDQKKSKAYYKDGKLDGKATQWFGNGQKSFEAIYKNGKANGKLTWWHENGQMMKELNNKDNELVSKDTGALSTSEIARKNNIAAKDLFTNLVKNDYLFKEGKNYKLTKKGQKIGGKHTKTKNFTFVVWDEVLFNVHIIDKIKPRSESIFKYPSTFSSILKEFGVKVGDEAWKSLERGTAILQTEEQLSQYLFSYGKMHRSKLNNAYKELFKELQESTKFSLSSQIEIIDYGCGQGIAAFILLNALDKVKFPIENILKITLIEPSKIALYKAVYFLDNSAKIVQVNKKLDDITTKDIKTDNSAIKIHLFSNILDMADEYFSIESLTNNIKSSQTGENYFVCVSVRNDHYLSEFVENIIETKIKSPLLDILENLDLPDKDSVTEKKSQKSVPFSPKTKLKNVKFISINSSNIGKWKRIHMIFKKQFK